MKKIIETVPNFSEGRDKAKIEEILSVFRGKDGVTLLDVHRDIDHNRMVVTVIGQPDVLKHAIIEAVGVAVRTIDMRTHRGEHPRMGAVGRHPFYSHKKHAHGRSGGAFKRDSEGNLGDVSIACISL